MTDTKEKILITGASGFIGSFLVARGLNWASMCGQLSENPVRAAICKTRASISSNWISMTTTYLLRSLRNTLPNTGHLLMCFMQLVPRKPVVRPNLFE